MSRSARRLGAARWGATGCAVVVTAVSVLGGAGMLPTSAVAPEETFSPVARPPDAGGVGDALDAVAAEVRRLPPPVPRRSGAGRRVVFSERQQRVWLVGADGSVRRTYLVSGSRYDNLDPGVYQVFSRSELAWGVDDTGTMEWMVRFTVSDRGNAIGFHDIPIDDGRPVQTVAQLGTPRSHGCIRQREADARALWRFAPVGTTVVVTA